MAESAARCRANTNLVGDGKASGVGSLEAKKAEKRNRKASRDLDRRHRLGALAACSTRGLDRVQFPHQELPTPCNSGSKVSDVPFRSQQALHAQPQIHINKNQISLKKRNPGWSTIASSIADTHANIPLPIGTFPE